MRYCFTLDDQIRFLEELYTSGEKDVFAHPYPALLRQLHLRYGAKFQLNLYERYMPGGFSLARLDARFAGAFAQNAHWLKLSFHARYNEPPFPYETDDGTQLREDITFVHRQILRFAGPDSLAATTTLHYGCASRAACLAAKEAGMKGLIGMFYSAQRQRSLCYALEEAQREALRHRSLYADPDTGLTFCRNDLIVDRCALESLEGTLEALAAAANPDQLLQIMNHEQYFYPDYEAYQPDYAEKMHRTVSWLASRGITACFLEDVLS